MQKDTSMKPNILQYATDAQALIDREYKAISESTTALELKSGELVKKAQDLLAREIKLNEREKSQDRREEEIVRKEGLIRDSEQSRVDREVAGHEHLAAERSLTKATEMQAEVKQKEEELYKRELALSEAKKTYKEEVRREFANSLLGRLS